MRIASEVILPQPAVPQRRAPLTRIAFVIALAALPLVPFVVANAADPSSLPVLVPPASASATGMAPSMPTTMAPVMAPTATATMPAINSPNMAATTATPPAMTAPNPMTSGAPTQNPVASAAVAVVPVVTTSPMSVAPPVPDAAATGNPIAKSTAALEEKATESGKSTIKKLEASSDPLTLEDLNAARQAIARIDAVIDVEKHLSELDKVRGEHSSSHSSSVAPAPVVAAPVANFASTIPASALAPMPTPVSMAPTHVVERHVEKEKPRSTLGDVEISRIIGSEGKYSAVLKMPNGDMKPVRIGDKLSEQATVRWISSSSVLVEEFGETHTLRIRNVDAIFSAMR